MTFFRVLVCQMFDENWNCILYKFKTPGIMYPMKYPLLFIIINPVISLLLVILLIKNTVSLINKNQNISWMLWPQIYSLQIFFSFLNWMKRLKILHNDFRIDEQVLYFIDTNYFRQNYSAVPQHTLTDISSTVLVIDNHNLYNNYYKLNIYIMIRCRI